MADKKYKVADKTYEIPDAEAQNFLKDFPTAVEVEDFTVGKDTFEIPINERDTFLKDYPHAISSKKKEFSYSTLLEDEDALRTARSQVPLELRGTPEQPSPSVESKFKIPEFQYTKPKNYLEEGKDVKQPVEVAKTFYEKLTGAAGVFDQKVASMFDGLDYIQNLLSDNLNQVLIGKKDAEEIRRLRNEGVIVDFPSNPTIPVRPFNAIAEAIRWTASGVKPLPNTVGGNILSGVAGVLPDIMAAVAAPEIKTSQILQKIGIPALSKFGMVMGAEGAIENAKLSEDGTPLQRLTAPAIGAIEGYMTGQMFDWMGGVSSQIGSKIANKIIPNVKTTSQALNKAILQHGSTSLTNAMFFGGYGNMDEFARTGKISAETFATNAGMGLALSARDMGKLLFAKGVNAFIGTPTDVIVRTAQSDIKTEDLAKQSQDKIDKIESGQSTNKEGDMVMAFMLAKQAQLKAMADEVAQNYDGVVKAINESTMPKSGKDWLINKVNEVVNQTDERAQAVKPISDDIKAIDDKIEAIKKNQFKSSAEKEIETEELEARKEKLKFKLIETYKKFKPTGEKKEAPQESETKTEEGVTDAERIGTQVTEGSEQPQGVVEGEEERLRVGDAEKVGVETTEGEVAFKEHRANIEQKFKDSFSGIPKEQVEGALALMDARAKSWASETGKSADEWYQRIADVKEGEFQDKSTPKLYQLPDGRQVMGMAMPEVTNGFYSPIDKRLAEFKQEKASVNKWKEIIGKGDEATFTGVLDYLNTLKPDQTLSKAEINQFMKDNRIEVVEVVKGEPSEEAISTFMNDEAGQGFTHDEAREYLINDESENPTKFHQYQLPGEKENYKEVLVTMPTKVKPLTDLENTELDKLLEKRLYEGLSTEEESKYRSLFTRRNTGGIEGQQFRSSHFDEPNILVHLRMNTRTDSEGKKVLFLEEVQSDWGQKGKREGFMPESKITELPNDFEILPPSKFKDYWSVIAPMGYKRASQDYEFDHGKTKEEAISNALKILNYEANEGKPPSAPFVTDTNAWVKLGLKTALREAIKQGVDRIAWTTGEQQNERYDLSKQVRKISVAPNKDGTYEIDAIRVGDEDGRYTKIASDVPANKIEEYVGKEIAQKVSQGEVDFEGENLKVGGKGMIGFYGSPQESKLGIVGNIAKSLFKQEPKTTNINIGDDELAMREEMRRQESVNQFENIPVESIGKIKSQQHSIDITPALKQEVEKGLPLFQIQPNDNKPYQEFSDATAIKAEKDALKEFPTTDDWRVTGWLTIGGHQLDFSGNNEGAWGHDRNLDHREVNRFLSDYDLKKYDSDKKWVGSNSTGMLAFMDMGNIRVSPESKGLGLHTMPSQKQFGKIREFIRKYNGAVIIDLNDIGYKEYEKYTNEDVIIDDIKRFYKEGVLPSERFFQKGKGKPKGAVETLADGRVIIHAMTRPDFSTLVHEITHVFEKDLTPQEVAIIEKWSGKKQGTREFSEAFARGGERYLRDGRAPNEQLKAIFEKFKAWLTDIYKNLKGTPLEKKLSPEVRKVFDRLLTEVQPAQSPKITLPSGENIQQEGKTPPSGTEVPPTPPKVEKGAEMPIGEGEKEYTIGVRALNSTKLDADIKNAIAQEGINYEPRGRKVRAEEAQEIVRLFAQEPNGLDKIEAMVYNTKNEILPDTRTYLNAYLASEYGRLRDATTDIAERNRYRDKIVSLLQFGMEQGKIGGQLVESQKEWAKVLGTSPEMIVALAQKHINDKNRAFFTSHQDEVSAVKQLLDDVFGSEEGRKRIEEEVQAEIEKIGTKNFGAESKKKIDDFFNGLLIDPKGQKMYDAMLGIPVAVWNGSVLAVKKAVLLTADIATAIQKGVEYIDKWYNEEFAKGKIASPEWNKKEYQAQMKDKLRGLTKEVPIKEKPTRKKEPKVKTPPTEAELLDKVLAKMAGFATKKQLQNFLKSYIQEHSEKGYVNDQRYKDLLAKALGMDYISDKTQAEITVHARALGYAQQKLREVQDAFDKLLALDPKSREFADLRKQLDKLKKEADKAQFNAQKANTEIKKLLSDEPELLDKISTLIQGNLLIPTSIIRNIYGNIFLAPARAMRFVFMNTADWMLSQSAIIADEIRAKINPVTHPDLYRYAQKLPSRERTVSMFGSMRGLREGWWSGLKEGISQLKTGQLEDDYKKKEIQRGLEPFQAMLRIRDALTGVEKRKWDKLVGDILESLPAGYMGEGMFRLLNLGDKPFRRGAEQARLSEIADIKGLKGIRREQFMNNPDNASLQEAQKAGDIAVYTNDNFVSKIIEYANQTFKKGSKSKSDAIKSTSVIAKALFKLGKATILPYVRTPVNLAIETFEYAVPSYSIARGVESALKGNRRESLDFFGKAVVGAIISSVAVSLLKSGIMTPAGSDEDKLKQAEFTAKEGYRLNLDALQRKLKGEDTAWQDGDHTITIRGYGTLSMIFMAYGAAYKDKTPEEMGEESIHERWATVFGSVVTSALEQSIMTGVNTALQAALKGEKERDRWLINTANAMSTAVYPNTFASISKTFADENYMRETRDLSKEEGQLRAQMVNAFKDRMFMGKDLPTKVSIWGEKVNLIPDGQTWTYNLLGVSKNKKYQKYSFGTRMYELYEEYKKKDPDEAKMIFPTLPSPATEVGWDDSKMSPFDLQNYQIRVGELRAIYAENYLNSEEFDQAPLDEKTSTLTSMYSKARKIAESEMFSWSSYKDKEPDKWKTMLDSEALPLPSMVRTLKIGHTEHKLTPEEIRSVNEMALERYAERILPWLEEKKESLVELKKVNEKTGKSRFMEKANSEWSRSLDYARKQQMKIITANKLVSL